MTLTRMLTAAGCAALLGGTAALAGDPAATAVNPTQSMHMDESKTMAYDADGAVDAKAAAAAQAGVDASNLSMSTDQMAGTVSVETVTNGPIPDTPENRAQYGGPNSRAGKMTAANGN